MNDLSVRLNQKYQIDMKKQSLNERFNENPVTLVQMALERVYVRFRGSEFHTRNA